MMTEKERYETIIDSLLETIKQKNSDILLLKWQVEDLKNSIADAETTK